MNTEQNLPATKISAHEKWMQEQGIPIIRSFNIPSLAEVELGRWERLGCNGSFIILDGAQEANDAYVLELPPGQSTNPEHHLYEEIIYVLSGRGATSIWFNENEKRSFEWHEGSLFAVPLNAWHKFFNGQGSAPARFYVVSSAPLVMNLYRNMDFIFNDNYVFNDRFDGRPDYFSKEGIALPDRLWETNLVEDVRDFPLLEWKARGAGGANRFFGLAEGTMTAHCSELPSGTYKKAHRHGPGANVIIIKGYGYSLLWPEGKDKVNVDWREGSVLVPPNMWFHQHFNTSAEPARYLAIHWGNKKYRIGAGLSSPVKSIDTSVKLGGNQIEYEDEEPYVRKLFESELEKNRVKCIMPPIGNN